MVRGILTQRAKSQLLVVRGQWSVVRDQWSEGGGQRSGVVVSSQLPVVSGL
jgi:hypothetical protein